MDRVHEGHLGLRPLKDIITLLPDNTLVLNNLEIQHTEKFYFLDLQTRVMYRIRGPKRYRIKHLNHINDEQTQKMYLRKENGWIVIVPEVPNENKGVPDQVRVVTVPKTVPVLKTTSSSIDLQIRYLRDDQKQIELPLPEGRTIHSTPHSEISATNRIVELTKIPCVIGYYYQLNGVRDGPDHYLICLSSQTLKYQSPNPGNRIDRPVFGKSLTTMYYANESVYHCLPEMKELIATHPPSHIQIGSQGNELKITHRIDDPSNFERVTLFRGNASVELLTFPQDSMVQIPIIYLDLNDRVRVEILSFELTSLYNKEISVQLHVAQDEIRDGLFDITEKLKKELGWLNPIDEFFPMNTEDGFEVTDEGFQIRLLPEERAFGKVVQRRVLGLTGSGKGQRILNLSISLPNEAPPHIIRYAQREQRIPLPHGKRIIFYNAISGQVLDPSLHDIQVMKENDIVRWLKVGSDYGARSVSFRLSYPDPDSGLEQIYSYNLLLTN